MSELDKKFPEKEPEEPCLCSKCDVYDRGDCYDYDQDKVECEDFEEKEADQWKKELKEPETKRECKLGDKNLERIEQEIQKQMIVLRKEINNVSIVRINALGGGIQKIKLAIIVALNIRENNENDIVFGFAWNSKDLEGITENLKRNQILVLRFYPLLIDVISRNDFLKFTLKVRKNENRIVLITDGRSDEVWERLGGKGLVFDLESFQERMLDIDGFALPECNKELLDHYWNIEESERTKSFDKHE